MNLFKHQSTKTYGHEQGLSACFRQWRATHSHCSLLHGYALAFHFVFGANELDVNNWVMDFGALKPLKQKLVDTFDHKLVVAGDDPELRKFQDLHLAGLADVLVLPNGVGCEAFAKLGFAYAEEVVCLYERSFAPDWQIEAGEYPNRRIHVVSCEVREHGANSAIFYNPHGHYARP